MTDLVATGFGYFADRHFPRIQTPLQKGCERSIRLRNPLRFEPALCGFEDHASAFWAVCVLILPASSVRRLRFRAALIPPCGPIIVRICRGLRTYRCSVVRKGGPQ